jgi:hypothetical protein
MDLADTKKDHHEHYRMLKGTQVEIEIMRTLAATTQ